MSKRSDERFSSCTEFTSAAAAALRGHPAALPSLPLPTVLNQPSAPSMTPANSSRPATSPPSGSATQATPQRRSVTELAPWPLAPIGDPPPASGATARTAAVLALLLGLLPVAPAVSAVIELSRRRTSPDAPGMTLTGLLVTAGISWTVLLLLIGGSVALLFRRRAGRFLVAGTTGLITIAAVIGAAVAWWNLEGGSLLFLAVIALVAGTAPLCAVSRSAGKCIAQEKRSVRA